MYVEALNKSDVMRIHIRLVEDFAQSGDPISPPGVQSEALLESAIGRQHVSLGNVLKYSTIHENAATLLYGLCCDHPFYNGNKRTALVAMLAHLDKNKRSLFGVPQKELFDMIIAVANHSFGVRVDPRRKGPSGKKRSSDDEVAAIAKWVNDRMYRIERGERQITYRELRRILGRFGYCLDHAKKSSIDVIKNEVREKGFFRKKAVTESKRFGSIGYPGETRFVPVSALKQVRKMCDLTEENGVDSASFYDDDAVLDAFINQYRTILRRLARR